MRRYYFPFCKRIDCSSFAVEKQIKMNTYKSLFIAALALACHCSSAFAQSNVTSPMVDVNGVKDLTLDSLDKVKTARPVAGSSRKGNNPVLFLVGNSTMRNGTLGNGKNGQWGWGAFEHEFFDESRITVENQALGGTSSRTFYRKLWPDVLKGIRKGDWVIIELGHNDNGPYDSGRARASIPGIGNDSLNVTIKETGVKETVYTYGEYMRRFIRETKAKGAYPILMSLTPRKAWEDKDSTRVVRVNKTFGLWAKQVAEAEGVPFIDLNEITARKLERFGKDKMQDMFYIDRIHTSVFGARLNAESAAEGIKNYPGLALAQYLKPLTKPTVAGFKRVKGRPAVFTVGDSTVKNFDKDKDGMWGWGSVFHELFDENKITVCNAAKAGRSARTFMDEGRWDSVYNTLQPGDYVLIQFGHNDGGDINVKKARGELHGAGSESKVFLMPDHHYEVVYTYGWYLRKFIMDALEKGATPIVLSPTARNIWKDGKIDRFTKSYIPWAKEVAASKNVPFIDLNTIAADEFEKKGQKKTVSYFNKDHTHSSLKGARANAKRIAKALKKQGISLSKYLK